MLLLAIAPMAMPTSDSMSVPPRLTSRPRRWTASRSCHASSNLPLLLKTRNQTGDAEQATRVAVAVVAACERAIALQTADEWVHPTLLVAAFHGGDVPKAQDLAEKVRAAPEDWKLASVLADLRDAVRLHPPGDMRAKLETLLQSLEPSSAGP